MTNPSGAPAGPFGRTLDDLFTAAPTFAAPTLGRTLALPGTALVEVPDLAGQGVDAAGQNLRERRLIPRVQLVETTGAVNTVKSQDPQKGSFVRPGSQVTLYVVTEREPGQFEQMVTAIRQAIKPEDLAKTTELTAAVAGLAKTSDVQNLPSKADLQTATGALEREDAASKRFEELKSLIRSNDGGGGPNSSKART